MIDISIIVLVYNQENYIHQCVKSVLDQKFDGVYEIIIFDDCSTDSTSSILNKIHDRYENIRLFKNNSNIGLSKNYQKAILKSKGKYIAYLEGDDYWTDPLKIQKQFDALERHRDYVLAFHDFVFVDKDSKVIDTSNFYNDSLKKNRAKKDMIRGCLIHQNTIIFRNVFRDLPIWFFKAKNHDTWLLAFLSNWGKALYVECSPLHYRIIGNSLWSSLSSLKKHYNGFVTSLMIYPVIPIKFYPVLLRKTLSKIYQMIKASFK
tara:strand:+ start:336 stop:1121 length:786 start_codon:yes stop_codon:yes gene_type:complete